MEYVKSIEELVSDPAFRNWVLEPDSINRRFWENLIDGGDPKLSQNIEKARLIVLSLEQPKTDFNADDESVLWDRIRSTIVEKDSDTRKIIDLAAIHQVQNHDKKQNRHWFLVAAVITILIAFYFSFRQTKEISVKSENEVVLIEKKVQKGQKLKLYLPDGSKVALNSQSKIVYPKYFSADKRIVEVEGEVFFEVKRDSLKPFIVRSKNMVTEVIGTTFNINAYPNSENTIVSLLEGKVKVSILNSRENNSAQNKNSVFLLPGEELNLNENSGHLIKRNIENMDELQWMDGVLTFHNESLPIVFDKLEMWYGVDFVFNKDLPRDEVLTGKFKNEYLDNILQSISYTVKFDYEIDGDIVYINFNGLPMR